MQMTEFDIKDILKECKKSAKVGYKIASSQYKNLNSTLIEAGEKIKHTIMEFDNSPCYVSSATELLSQQLIDIEQSFNLLSFAFKDDLENLRENQSKFTITLFGQTMVGKSTLMEILTQGDGKSIGTGAQRKTRDVRSYPWNNLEIIDVPGVAAFEGEDDEQIAFEAAKSADLILFLITDDAPQAYEAECFGRIVNLGKPIICIMNIKVAISENRSIEDNLWRIEDAFDMERLNTIRTHFLAYAQQLGQEWGYVPFEYVHLSSAFKSQNMTDKEAAKNLYRISRIYFLKNKIIEQVRNKGEFYRIKTFIDIISIPMIESMENLLSQSLLNSAQGRTILSKKRQLREWKDSFERDGKSRIQSLIVTIKSQLNSEIAAFTEEHFSDKHADKAWNTLLKDRKIETLCQALLEDLEERCNDKIKEVSREITNELMFASAFTLDSSLKMHKIIDGKKVWNWSATIVGGGLSIAYGIAYLTGAVIDGPLGWVAMAVGALGVVGAFIFKSRDKKEHKARRKLEDGLRKNVTFICDTLLSQMEKNFSSLISVRIEGLMKEMDRINSVVFRLADTQKELAWKLNNHLLELNSQIVTEAIKLIGSEGLEHHIKSVGRIPGIAVVFLLNDGTVFPMEEIKKLRILMSENIGFVFDTDDKRVLISRIIGKSIDRYLIRIEEKIGVAHIPIKGATPNVKNKVCIAQQFSRLVITN